jgi:hypothetical protein
MVSHFGIEVRIHLTLQNRKHDPEIVGWSIVWVKLRAGFFMLLCERLKGEAKEKTGRG